MQKIPRRTNHSLEELINLFNNNNSNQYPSSMIINEIGIVCKNGDDKDRAGEKHLLSLLNDKNDNNRAIAFCYLVSINEMADRHSAIITEFRSKKENQSLLEFIDKHLNEEQ
ncbi:MAG: hypothetical protein US50_C0016G0009 [Candidatus Nomurabacteria bacterium GW2011_GWB1_37_5]|uniref:Uncharacterized protein n=1 Tax=Candidatus Nomurabacteria bacterium GW2011_GWB1_37_5 TaxID=1618742 RepID=A0A0G0JF38_9BACT|nr:MAG: hypothetical protein US50_C0016G0009 [Candidatus Nomurabacteria bacterium GW2011_GWB1_37_5]